MSLRALLLLPVACLLASAPELNFPTNYRGWVFLSSGLGMTYGPAATQQGPPSFDNVFVNPESYRAFLNTGHWPDKTTFVLEIRNSESHGSINKDGHFQRAIRAIEAEVKQDGKWSFFSFPMDSGKPASAGNLFPQDATCYSCHLKNAAVENTFVQFYPELYDVALKKGTLNPNFEKLPTHP